MNVLTRKRLLTVFLLINAPRAITAFVPSCNYNTNCIPQISSQLFGQKPESSFETRVINGRPVIVATDKKRTLTPETMTSETNTQQIKAVIFDLDGTLLDTEVLSDRAMFMALGPSLPENVREEIRKDGDKLPWEIKSKILGMRGSEWIPMVVKYAQEHWGVAEESSAISDDCNDSEEDEKKSSEKLPPPPPLDEFWRSWEDNLSTLCLNVEECPGATKLVEELAKLDVPLAIATSSRLAAVNKKRVKHDKMFKHIPIIVAGDDEAVKNGKPAPDIYVEAARRLGVHPSECLVFEDGVPGAKSGSAAGCQVIAVPDPRMDKSVFHAIADVVLDDLWHFNGERWGLELNMADVKNQLSVSV